MRLYFVPFEDDIMEDPYQMGEENFANLPILGDKNAWNDYNDAVRAMCAALRKLNAAMLPATPLTDEEKKAFRKYEERE